MDSPSRMKLKKQLTYSEIRKKFSRKKKSSDNDSQGIKDSSWVYTSYAKATSEVKCSRMEAGRSAKHAGAAMAFPDDYSVPYGSPSSQRNNNTTAYSGKEMQDRFPR